MLKQSEQRTEQTSGKHHESMLFIVSIIAIGILGPTEFLGMPAVVGTVEQHWGFGEAAIGMSSFAEVLGESIGTLLVAFVLGRQPVRLVLAGVALLAAGANFATLGAHGLVAYSMLQFLGGIGSGGLNGIALRYLSYTRTPERHLSAMLLGQVVWSMLLVGCVFPALSATWGAAGLFGFIAAMFATFPLVALLFRPGETLARPVALGTGGFDKAGSMLVLAAQLALYGGVGVVWTFLEQIGRDAGLGAGAISTVLTVANVVSLAVCILMPRLGAGAGLRRWALVNLAGRVLAVGLLARPASTLTFSLGAVLFIACWTGAALLIYSTIPQYDLGGKCAVLLPGCVALGYGVGSIAGGALLESMGTAMALWGAIGLCAVSFACYAWLRPAVFANPAFGDPQLE